MQQPRVAVEFAVQIRRIVVAYFLHRFGRKIDVAVQVGRRNETYLVQVLWTEQKNVALGCGVFCFVYDVVGDALLENKQFPLIVSVRRVRRKILAGDLVTPHGKKLNNVLFHEYIVAVLSGIVKQIAENKK